MATKVPLKLEERKRMGCSVVGAWPAPTLCESKATKAPRNIFFR